MGVVSKLVDQVETNGTIMITGTRIILYALIVTLLACNANSVPVGDTSKNALDWEGTYYGVLPCADCPGILTTIVLNDDNSFTFSRSYLGKSDAAVKKSGSFSWNDAENQITLKETETSDVIYKVGENKLIPVYESKADERFVLTKGNREIVNRYWKLVHVEGATITSDGNQRKEPHFILLSKDNAVFGNGSCNNFRGTFELSDDKLSFSPLAATKMACMETMDVENQFLKALTEVKGYEVSGDSLFLLNDEKAKVLTFVLRGL